MSFRQEMKERRWLVSGSGQTTTHLLMDGTGKLSVPEQHSGTFLNLYFAAVVVRGEPLSVVEQRSPVFKLFFDLDLRVRSEDESSVVVRRLVAVIWKFVAHHFFVLEVTDGSDCLDDDAPRPDRMVVCTAAPKREDSGLCKTGVHIVFPGIFVNSPVACRCREALLDHLDAAYYDASTMATSSSAQSVTQFEPSTDTAETVIQDEIPAPANSWRDILDDAVYKGSGLRMIFSNKGRYEARPYAPALEMDGVQGLFEVACSTFSSARAYIHDTSIRTQETRLTVCRNGEHAAADRVDRHLSGTDTISGTTQSLEAYADVLPKIRRLLPEAYRDLRFLKAFVTSSTVFLKTNSRYCLNVKREHRTSTIYVSVTRTGMCVRCYSRKDEYSCRYYASPAIELPPEIVRVFFPEGGAAGAVSAGSEGSQRSNDSAKALCFQSARKRRSTSHSILHTNPLFTCKR